MKGCNERLCQTAVPQQTVDALTHLAGRFIGECHRKNRIRRHAFFLDKPRNPAGNDARFARARAGKDQERPLGGFDRGALFGIQIGMEWEQDYGPDRKVPSISLPVLSRACGRVKLSR